MDFIQLQNWSFRIKLSKWIQHYMHNAQIYYIFQINMVIWVYQIESIKQISLNWVIRKIYLDCSYMKPNNPIF